MSCIPSPGSGSRQRSIALALAAVFSIAATSTQAQSGSPSGTAETPVKSLGIITVTGGQPTSLPTQIPTTMEGIAREQIETTINATDSEDALKYFPSLIVRKRYIGDYNHAVLSSRASGTGNSARSAVYADGILLSNYLGNGATYAPRWGLVTPEEIERVDAMYGPFSAAYPGNSVGAVVDYVTRMPTRFEAHAKLSHVSQPFDLYNTHETYNAKQASTSLGDRKGDWSWWVNVNRTDSHGQPLTFPWTTGKAGGAGTTVVTGAVPVNDKSNAAIYLLGTGTEYKTLQDHAKLKLAYDISPTLRASYTLGIWDNTSENRPKTYLRDAAGNPVYSGAIKIDGANFTIAATDFSLSNEKLSHVMHGLSVKSNSQGIWDWEVAASLYDYSKDQLRTATIALPAAFNGGAGTITDQNGTGWNNIALKGIWRPQGARGEHIVDFGFQQDNYKLRILKSNIAGNWMADGPGSLNTDVGGRTRLRSLYGQDTWAFAPKWKTVLGARIESWTAFGGYTRTAASSLDYASRSENYVSPKAALAYQLTSASVLKASTGRAVRMPTVNELYGATTGVLTVVNDPNLKPEKSWTSELTLETDLGNGLLRTTLFYEAVRDSLYSERIGTVTRITNVGRIVTPGAELAYQGNDVLLKGLDLSGSVTYSDSRIKENDGFVTVAGDTIGKYQPRVPVWRAVALAAYRFNQQLTGSLGWRYKGNQFTTLNNSDPNGFAYQGDSPFKVVDLRLRYQIAKQWSAAFGIDNLGNYKYWAFHPYPQRSYSAELKFDL
jgi:iron complex outermembrane receptor protein